MQYQRSRDEPIPQHKVPYPCGGCDSVVGSSRGRHFANLELERYHRHIMVGLQDYLERRSDDLCRGRSYGPINGDDFRLRHIYSISMTPLLSFLFVPFVAYLELCTRCVYTTGVARGHCCRRGARALFNPRLLERGRRRNRPQHERETNCDLRRHVGR